MLTDLDAEATVNDEQANNLIYLDHGATSYPKPKSVADAMRDAMRQIGSAGRSFHEPAMRATREIFKARQAVAELAGIKNPLQVAFTSGATESLNLAILGLVGSTDHVITSEAEHTSVLRPLYLSGASLSYLKVDENGILQLDALETLVRPNTRLLAVTHGSNVTGNLTDVGRLKSFCDEHGLMLLLDIAQTFGHTPITAALAHVMCFTGHKGLWGPQGTGGIIVPEPLSFRIVKTGGTGMNSFSKYQLESMPDVFEVGTQNAHGLYGLRHGIEYIRDQSLEAIQAKEKRLTRQLIDGIRALPGYQMFGDMHDPERLPVVSFRWRDDEAALLADYLWRNARIATRAGSHCAPHLHEALGTKETGLVRLSLSHQNEVTDVDTALYWLRRYAEERSIRA